MRLSFSNKSNMDNLHLFHMTKLQAEQKETRPAFLHTNLRFCSMLQNQAALQRTRHINFKPITRSAKPGKTIFVLILELFPW